MMQGYARDVIDVIENDTNKKVKALLYRGTPDNPAFWKRALLDLPFAAGKSHTRTYVHAIRPTTTTKTKTKTKLFIRHNNKTLIHVSLVYVCL